MSENVKAINYLDLFAGCGGFHKGLQDAGFKFGWTGFSEIDKHAKKVYKTHFPESEDLGDVRTVDPDKLPKIDLITFGFPCQDLSVAGKQAGLGGARSGLFFEAMRIVRSTRPCYFIFENVKGLFSSNEGRDWLTVLREVADSGYDGQWQLLNTRWFLPHDRERVYFIGHRRGESRPQTFPFTEGDGEFIRANRKSGPEGMGVARSLDANYHKGPDGKRTHLILRDNWGENIKQRVKDISQPCWTLGGSETVLQVGDQIRALTPLEFERLHGFPDYWTVGISDTQRYKMLGNAVSVPVVKAVGERLIKCL